MHTEDFFIITTYRKVVANEYHYHAEWYILATLFGEEKYHL